MRLSRDSKVSSLVARSANMQTFMTDIVTGLRQGKAVVINNVNHSSEGPSLVRAIAEHMHIDPRTIDQLIDEEPTLSDSHRFDDDLRGIVVWQGDTMSARLQIAFANRSFLARIKLFLVFIQMPAPEGRRSRHLPQFERSSIPLVWPTLPERKSDHPKLMEQLNEYAGSLGDFQLDELALGKLLELDGLDQCRKVIDALVVEARLKSEAEEVTREYAEGSSDQDAVDLYFTEADVVAALDELKASASLDSSPSSSAA